MLQEGTTMEMSCDICGDNTSIKIILKITVRNVYSGEATNNVDTALKVQ